MRTNYCGELNKENIDQTVEICGWVNRRRDHGGVIFLDIDWNLDIFRDEWPEEDLP